MATLAAGPLNLLASSPGTWGKNLAASVDTKGITDDVASQYAKYGLTTADLFNLTVQEIVNGQIVATEVYYAVSVLSTAGPRRRGPRVGDTVTIGDRRQSSADDESGRRNFPWRGHDIGEWNNRRWKHRNGRHRDRHNRHWNHRHRHNRHWHDGHWNHRNRCNDDHGRNKSHIRCSRSHRIRRRRQCEPGCERLCR